MPLPTTATVDRPQAGGYDAQLDELYLRLAVAPDRQLRIESAQTSAQRINTAQTNEDFIFDKGVVFSRNNFTGGEGLAFAHRVNAGERDSTRYWDSRGIDVAASPAGQLPQLRLLNATALAKTESGSNPLRMDQLPDGSLLYTVGNILRKISLPASSLSSANEDPHTGTQAIKDIAVLGNQAYAACGSDGMGKRNSGGTWANLGAVNLDRIWAVKRRLIGLNGSVVVEINETTGAHTTLLTLPSGAVVNDVTDAGAVILIAASDGYIYAVRDDGGTLALQSQTEISSKEQPIAIAHRAGIVLISTRAPADDTAGKFVGRLYVGRLPDNTAQFAVQELVLVKEFGIESAAALDYSLTRMYVTRDSIYSIGQWSASETHMWRYHLATGGLSRDLIFPAGGIPQGLEVVGGYFFTTIAVGGTAGLYREATTKVASGWIMTPMADFFTPAEKQWLGFQMNVGGFDNGGVIVAEYSRDPDALLDVNHSSWFPALTAFTEDQSNVEVPFAQIESRYMGLKITLGNSDGPIYPTLQSFALRADTQTDDYLVQLPVNVSDRIEPPNRRPFTVPGWGDTMFQELLGREGKTATIVILRSGLTFRGVVESVAMPASGIEERGSLTAYALVTMRGRLLSSASGGFAGTGTFGVGKLGIGLLGA